MKMKMNELRKVIKLKREKLDKVHFFESLIEVGVKEKYLEPEMLQNLQMQLLNLLALKIEKYNAGKSSSIPKKTAEKLMQSIYFTLGFYLKSLEDLDESILLLHTKPLKEMLEEGQRQIEMKVEEVREELQQLERELLLTKNIAYQDTYTKGLAPFFKAYKPEFFSQDMQVSIDYPLSIDDMKGLGIEYVAGYIEKSLLENQLCKKFEPEEIENLLESYEKGYEHLLINIYELVLMNVTGRKLLNYSLEHLMLEEGDLKKLQEKLEIAQNIEEVFYKAAAESLTELRINSKEMKHYVSLTLGKLLPHIKAVIQEKKLEQIFITKKEEETQFVTYTGGRKLSDEDFKVLTEEIRSCHQLKDKIKCIREKVTHVEDLRDILEADCLYGEEYQGVYNELDAVEIALLLNKELADEFGRICIDEIEDKEWKIRLLSYLNRINPEKKGEITNMVMHIIEKAGE